MNRIYQNYVIDLTILLSGILCGFSGIIKWPGLVDGLGLSYQALPMELLTLVHDWTGILMIVFAALHVLLHMKWLTSMTKKLLKLNGGKNEKA
jgi:hypothetical protein